MVDLLDIRLKIGLEKELKGNRLASLLHRNVENHKMFNESRLNLVQNLIGGYSKESLNYKPEIDEVAIKPFQDLRFCYLTICNIKKYPGKINECLYGVSFVKEKVPVHSVFLGSNGVGKTSLYAALEYLGMRKMNTAIVRGYNRLIGQVSDIHGETEVDQREFLLRSQMDIKDSSIGLYCNHQAFLLEGKQIIAKSTEKLVCDSFFCSAYDVEQLERCQDFTSFFVNQTGLSDYYNCLQSLYYLHRYIMKFENKESMLIDGLLDTESQEAIARLQFGISLGAVGVDAQEFAYTVYLDDICNFDLSNQSLYKLIQLLNEASLKLRYEDDNLLTTSWFILPIKQKYEKIIQVIDSIKRDLKKGSFSLFREKSQFIKDFNSFRSNLLKSIIGIQTSVKNSVSAESKRLLCDSLILELFKLNEQKSIDDSERFKNNSLDSNVKAQFIEDLNSLIEYLEHHLIVLVRLKEKKIKDSIENLLSDSFALDNDKVNIDISFKHFKDREPIIKEQNKNEFEREYIKKDVHEFIKFDVKILSSRGELKSGERIPVDPRSYLNTFRYKLFCVALKLAFLCISKEAYNINFPFVIDDVFDSSDFDSRLKLNDFMKDLIEMHNTLLPEDKYALQLIFFTQDDLIANQVYKGLISKVEKNNVKFSQIFDYHECNNKDDIRKITLTDNQMVMSSGTENPVDNNDESTSPVSIYQYVSVEDIIE